MNWPTPTSASDSARPPRPCPVARVSSGEDDEPGRQTGERTKGTAAPGPRRVGPQRHGRRRGNDPHGEVKGRVHQALIDNLGPRLYDPHLPEAELASQVRRTLQETIDAEETPLSHADRTRIAQEVSDEILGHGPLEPLLRDPDITEIMVNGPDYVFVERAGKIYPVEARFSNEAHLRRVIDKIVGRVGRRIDEASPLVDARLPDGSRVNAVIAPIALDGAMLTIRKFSQDPFTDSDLIAFGTISPPVRDFLRACVVGRRNIIISGGTGSGKTTTLNVISSFLPEDERIITIEDAAELQLHQEHVLRLESRPANIEGRGNVAIRDLVKNALRMRPDRIVVGEVRDGAALDMLQAMNTGHDGSITTVHANSPETPCRGSRPWCSWVAWNCPFGRSGSRWPEPSTSSSSRLGSRTVPDASSRSARWSAWRVTSSRCRTSSPSTTPPGETKTVGSVATWSAPACGRSSRRI